MTINLKMFTFISPLYSLLLLILILLTTTTAQPYIATDYILLDCGSTATTTSDRKWDRDDLSEFVPANTTTTSFTSITDTRDPSVPRIPYSTARVFNNSPFTYSFPVSRGPKFLRLFFYPTNQSFFSVSANGYSLLTNFSAFQTAAFLGRTRVGSPRIPHFVKEFIVYVQDSDILNVTFTPLPNSYAFVNGIEVVSMPENLYFKRKKLKYVGQITGPVIDEDTALENMYRLNVGGSQISGNNDTGMYRSWDQDDGYIYGAAIGLTPVSNTPIMYTIETPNYTAPELVYATQRSMGTISDLYNLTWILPVDSGYYYKLRLHFCNIIPQYTKIGQVVFKVFINNQTADEEIDLFHLTQGIGYPVFKDYIVFVHDPDGHGTKQDLWVAIHPNTNSDGHHDAYLNGLEAFKLSMDVSLSSPNPELITPLPKPASPVNQNTKKNPRFGTIIGGLGGGLVLLTILVFMVVWKWRVKREKSTKSTDSDQTSLPSDRCRRFSLTEIKLATCEFNDNCVIGKGGFGRVYKGYIDKGNTVVAIKRLDTTSKQGFLEFQTEIGFLSKLRHVQLVSLIGYCVDNGEMILVYDYMARGTLREHLYKTNNPSLSWKKRLEICIGAAKGLHYLHTGANRAIIHRDVKSTNILLDENWVAKVSDFGLSKLGPNDQSQDHITTKVKGTIGYMDPEYFHRGQLTEKSDVYSFGVVLLEVFCARPVIKKELPYEQANLAEWGRFCYRKGTIHEIIDPDLIGEIAPKCLRKFTEVAISCLKKDGSQRPTMDDVVWGLEFAMQLQKAAEETGDMVDEVGFLDNREVLLLGQGEITTTDDEYALFGSSGDLTRRVMRSIDSSTEGFESETATLTGNRS